MNHHQFWIKAAAYYRAKLDDSTIMLYASDIENVDINKILELFEDYRRDPKNKTLPMPSYFLEKINPITLDPKDQAREVSSRISAAIVKFGWPNPDEARDYIGEVGWKVVDRYGGWKKVCEMVGVDINPAIFLAQTRDLSESLIRNQNKKEFDQPINFLEKTNKQELSLISNNSFNKDH